MAMVSLCIEVRNQHNVYILRGLPICTCEERWATATMDLYPYLKSVSSAHHGYRGGGGDTSPPPPVKEIVMLNSGYVKGCGQQN